MMRQRRPEATTPDDRFSNLMDALKGGKSPISNKTRQNQTALSLNKKDLRDDRGGRVDQYKRYMSEVMKLLDCYSLHEVPIELRRVKKDADSVKALKKFAGKMMEMIVENSPEGTYKKPPSLRHMWNWYRKQVDENAKTKE